MMLTIGNTTLATRQPADLDAILVASSGCNAAEHAAMIRKGTPFQVARAAMPFLVDEDAPSIGALASMIDGADLADVRDQVLALLSPVGVPVAHDGSAEPVA
ncbi:hypothetical protein [Sphingomonas sp. TREG-RG-20F-R18-01]|uniref:hypothetical protein n=1 Tax=Sphingomonas sp. TREG-RG-20F-R18-01 TaxID=2914982 RepID=UPI001F566F9D|nr:hypothetical protein [Sphingomonas sp. TREG-RG-20F-R18-01]